MFPKMIFLCVYVDVNIILLLLKSLALSYPYRDFCSATDFYAQLLSNTVVYKFSEFLYTNIRTFGEKITPPPISVALSVSIPYIPLWYGDVLDVPSGCEFQF